MQTYKQLQEGSYGEDVKKLQQELTAKGYTLDIDGQYGPKTAAAVKQYQKANALAADGIAGAQTLRHLYSTAAPEQTAPEQTAPEQTIPKATGYVPGSTVEAAKDALDAQAAQRPGGYTSAWEEQLEAVLDQLLSRESFSYDINEDALYQQLRDQYVRQGQLAMMDTLGRGAALTGGYGNSYALTAGQQAYQGHLQDLAALAPELRQDAYEAYRQQGQDLLDRYALMQEAESGDYAKYRQAMDAWLAERDYLAGRYDTERGYDYQRYLDTLAQQQWEAEFAESQRRYNLENGLTGGSGGGGGGGSGGGSGSPDTDDSQGQEDIMDYFYHLTDERRDTIEDWVRGLLSSGTYRVDALQSLIQKTPFLTNAKERFYAEKILGLLRKNHTSAM